MLSHPPFLETTWFFSPLVLRIIFKNSACVAEPVLFWPAPSQLWLRLLAQNFCHCSQKLYLRFNNELKLGKSSSDSAKAQTVLNNELPHRSPYYHLLLTWGWIAICATAALAPPLFLLQEAGGGGGGGIAQLFSHHSSIGYFTNELNCFLLEVGNWSIIIKPNLNKKQFILINIVFYVVLWIRNYLFQNRQEWKSRLIKILFLILGLWILDCSTAL